MRSICAISVFIGGVGLYTAIRYELGYFAISNASLGLGICLGSYLFYVDIGYFLGRLSL